MLKTGRYVLIASLTLWLVGCGDHYARQAPIEKVNPATVAPEPPPVTTVPAIPRIPGQPEAVPVTPPVRHYQWEATIQPMIDQMLQAKGVNPGSVLLVDNMNNRTNGALDIDQATSVLRNAADNNGKLTLVSPQQLTAARQQLGLSPQDSLGGRSKAIGIARSVGAQYVLYSSVTGSASLPELKMQLMLVQTGEIIWSGKGVIQQQ
ncbi:penicillin-binding protein activator LpoB [Enterobacteriaceae bacterium ESL0689]|nr:penicillin-binding protein activator LpoB [Enterobacteriaceae bacterium ESL0689]